MPEPVKRIVEAIRPRLGRLFNSLDPTLEVNLVAYGFGILVLAFTIVWWTVKGQRDVNLVGAMTVFAAAITGGLFKKGSNAAQQQTPGAGAPDKDGGA